MVTESAFYRLSQCFEFVVSLDLHSPKRYAYTLLVIYKKNELLKIFLVLRGKAAIIENRKLDIRF